MFEIRRSWSESIKDVHFCLRKIAIAGCVVEKIPIEIKTLKRHRNITRNQEHRIFPSINPQNPETFLTPSNTEHRGRPTLADGHRGCQQFLGGKQWNICGVRFLSFNYIKSNRVLVNIVFLWTCLSLVFSLSFLQHCCMSEVMLECLFPTYKIAQAEKGFK